MQTSGTTSKSFKNLLNNYQLYLLLLPTVLYYIIFVYWPMYGLQIAFKHYNVIKGVTGSPWAGFSYFEKFFNSFQFSNILQNTVYLSLYHLVVSFPIPIIVALLLNQVSNERFKKLVQTVTYAPHFISVAVTVGMLFIFLSPEAGLANKLLQAFGFEPIFFMGDASWFRSIYVWSGVWQSTGISMIIYLAALSSVDPSLHEAAIVDGASRTQRIRHIDFPGILPTVSVLLILSVGHLMSVGVEKVYLMQNSLNSVTSEIISTYIYKVGLLNTQFSYSAAIGFFDAAINCCLLIIVNYMVRKRGEASLW